MTRKMVQTGSSLAVTLPREVLDAFKLKKGDDVEVALHPQSGAIVIRPGVRQVENGKVTRRFQAISRRILEKHRPAFDELSK